MKKVTKWSELVLIDESEIEQIKDCHSQHESKEWKYEGKQYIAHYDVKNNAVYLNGHRAWNCFDIWFNVDSTNETLSWRAKHKAKEIEIARIESMGIVIDRMEYPQHQETTSEKIGYILLMIAVFSLLGLILYFIYQVWWFFIGEWSFEGPFADNISGGEVFWKTCVFFIAFIVIIEEVIRRCRNGHF